MAIAKLVKSKMRGLSVLLNRNVSNNASQACRTNETDKALSNANAQESAPAENAPNNAIAQERGELKMNQIMPLHKRGGS